MIQVVMEIIQEVRKAQVQVKHIRQTIYTIWQEMYGNGHKKRVVPTYSSDTFRFSSNFHLEPLRTKMNKIMGQEGRFILTTTK